MVTVLAARACARAVGAHGLGGHDGRWARATVKSRLDGAAQSRFLIVLALEPSGDASRTRETTGALQMTRLSERMAEEEQRNIPWSSASCISCTPLRYAGEEQEEIGGRPPSYSMRSAADQIPVLGGSTGTVNQERGMWARHQNASAASCEDPSASRWDRRTETGDGWEEESCRDTGLVRKTWVRLTWTVA